MRPAAALHRAGDGLAARADRSDPLAKPASSTQRRAAPAQGAGHVPLRRPGTVRRTQSIDIGWPGDRSRPSIIRGASRDIRTMANGVDIEIFGRADMDITLSPRHELLALASSARDDRLQSLVGASATGGFRSKLRGLFPSPEERGSGHYLLLDDLPGAVFVSNWAWICWDMAGSGPCADIRDSLADPATSMAGVCIGLAAGSSALDGRGFPDIARQSSAIVPDIAHPDDIIGWHSQPSPPRCPGSRRCRWLDLARDGQDIVVSTGFQDSAIQQNGLRRAVHEYHVDARIGADGTILDVAATPHILPYATCPAAIGNIGALVGLPVSTLREAVPAMLAREAGCTHLNDVLRSLASITSLAPHLPPLAS